MTSAGILCSCGCVESEVKDSRPEVGTIRRRRQCRQCGRRFTTHEVAMSLGQLMRLDATLAQLEADELKVVRELAAMLLRRRGIEVTDEVRIEQARQIRLLDLKEEGRLSTRAFNAIRHGLVEAGSLRMTSDGAEMTVAMVARLGADRVEALPDCGPSTVREIEQLLAGFGLSLARD